MGKKKKKNSLRNLRAIAEMRHVSKIPEESKEKMGQKKYWKKTQTPPNVLKEINIHTSEDKRYPYSYMNRGPQR